MKQRLDGQAIDDCAIERIRFHEPPDGYWLAFSGGKDSTVIYDLAVRAGVKFEAHYSVTGIDPPELVQHIRQHYPTVAREMPPQSIWKMIEHVRGMPHRQRRWCCRELKERGGAGRTVLTGVRWAESARRRKRSLYETCYRDATKHYLHPIIDWSEQDVWEYIHERNLPYCRLYDEGFRRLGCVLCPMTSAAQAQREMARWPKLADAWRRAAYRYYEHSTGATKFGSPEAFWQWWISRKARRNEAQMVMFE